MKLKSLLGLFLVVVMINMTYANISYTNKIENQNTAVQIQMFIPAPELYSPPDIAVSRALKQQNFCLVNSLSVEAKKNMAARPPDIAVAISFNSDRFNVNKEVNLGVVEPPDIVLSVNEETDRTIIQAGIIKPPDIIVTMAHDALMNTQVKENSSVSTKKTTFHLNEKIHVNSTKSDQYVLHDVSHHLRC